MLGNKFKSNKIFYTPKAKYSRGVFLSCEASSQVEIMLSMEKVWINTRRSAKKTKLDGLKSVVPTDANLEAPFQSSLVEL